MGNRKPTVIAVNVVMAIAATVAVALRFRARRIKKLDFGWDDYTIVLGLLFSLAICATLIAATAVGNLGGHVGTLPLLDYNEFNQEIRVFYKIVWAVQIFSVLGPGFTKLSILLFYQRIFVGKVFNVLTWIAFAITFAWTVGFFFANLLDCIPFSGNWGITDEEVAGCVDVNALLVALSISDILSDLFILVLPWYPIWHLKMPLRRKLAVCGILLLGGFVVAVGVIRFMYGVYAIQDNTPDFDFTYDDVALFCWATVETCVGVISACLPTFRPLFSDMNLNLGSFLRSLRDSIASHTSSLTSSSNNNSNSNGNSRSRTPRHKRLPSSSSNSHSHSNSNSRKHSHSHTLFVSDPYYDNASSSSSSGGGGGSKSVESSPPLQLQDRAQFSPLTTMVSSRPASSSLAYADIMDGDRDGDASSVMHGEAVVMEKAFDGLSPWRSDYDVMQRWSLLEPSFSDMVEDGLGGRGPGRVVRGSTRYCRAPGGERGG
ncbi:hypothetical protein MMC25_006924 [Agyrium rufum]|nr:hypothetical protein [Agyrium rufum]